LNAAPGDAATVDAAKNELSGAVANPTCSAAVMSPERCRETLETARQWLGWIALGKEEIEEAARRFQGFDTTGWPAWVAGRIAFRDRKYPEAARQYRAALDVWTRREPSLLSQRLGPQPILPRALADLGGAQLLARDTAAAIATLDNAIKADPAAARAYWLRARAKELAGQTAAAFTDYNMAARTALANAPEDVSGEGSVYRGILLYRRKEFSQAEDEFAAAATRGVPADLKADATAWRHLAAVASGACGSEREYLERSLATVSPYFPRDDARAAMTACPAGLSSTAGARAK
jgi:tetratricopeptide (TPR) repeat protein